MKHLLVVTLLSLSCAMPLASFAAEQRPNILLVVADDLGWSDVGWHGGFGRTPVMDKLVREGIELDQHYVQPVCTPTRAALKTGRNPGRFGPHVLAPSNRRALPPGTTTLASALKSLGYRTHLRGKWHLGARPAWGPNAYGFETSYGSLTGAADPWTHKYIYIAKKDARCLRLGDWKLIVSQQDKRELYNLATDPFETKNLPAKASNAPTPGGTGAVNAALVGFIFCVPSAHAVLDK